MRAMDHERRIDEEAGTWLVLMGAGNVADADRAAFDAWLAVDPLHAQAYDEATRLWREVAELDHLAGAAGVDQPLFRERLLVAVSRIGDWARDAWTRPATAAAGAFAAIVLVVAIWTGSPGTRMAPAANHYTTQVAEIRDLRLPDDSIVTLGARSAIEVAFSASERHVTLTEGEAIFSVTRDPARPFVVVAGDAVVRVVGTRFEIHHGPEQVRVTVLEGVVEVTRPEAAATTAAGNGGPSKQVLTAGQAIVAPKGGALRLMRKFTAADTGAWLEGRLVYRDIRLAEVIADANRYFDGEIVFASRELGDLRVTASFRSDEIERLINTLEIALPISADRSLPGKILLRARPDQG